MSEPSISIERIKPRLWWIAALLAVICPPVAYLYVGRPMRALAIIGAYVMLGVVLWHGLFGLLVEPAGVATFLAAIVALFLFVLIDCIRIARAAGDYSPRGFNRWWWYIGAFVGFTAAVSIAFDPAWGFRRAARAIAIPSGSMIPTLRIGELAFADARAYERSEPRRGDIVIFDGPPSDPASLYVKRIVGLPGDAVQMRGGRLFLNDEAVPTAPAGFTAPVADLAGKPLPILRERLPAGAGHLIVEEEAGAPGADTEVFKVPPDSFFVLGDNRGNSADSRFPTMGPAPRSRLRGKVLWIYWSSDSARIGARLE